MTTSRQIKDAVAVFTGDFNQVFPRARIVKAVVEEPAKLMEHPLETGATIVDHRIILPIRIELSTVLQSEDYKDTYRQIKQLFLNSTVLSVQTRSSVYTNQIIAEMPHEENPDMYDAKAVAIKLKQVLFANTSSGIKPKRPQDQPTVQRGLIPTQDGGPSTQADGVIT